MAKSRFHFASMWCHYGSRFVLETLRIVGKIRIDTRAYDLGGQTLHSVFVICIRISILQNAAYGYGIRIRSQSRKYGIRIRIRNTNQVPKSRVRILYPYSVSVFGAGSVFRIPYPYSVFVSVFWRWFRIPYPYSVSVFAFWGWFRIPYSVFRIRVCRCYVFGVRVTVGVKGQVLGIRCLWSRLFRRRYLRFICGI